MFKRKITKILEEWKKEDNKQCLLIRGARQVGKTFIIEQFCKANYESYIYINFDLSPTRKTIFDGDLDADTLIMKLEVTFPDIEIKSKEYLIIYLSDSVSGNSQLHANFSLKQSGGEIVTLRKPNGKVADTVKTVKLDNNISFARDSQGKWITTSEITPGYENNKNGREII